MTDPTDLLHLLDPRSIVLDGAAPDRDSAIRLVGGALVDVGAVTEAYVDAMIARERSVSTYLGEGVALPHGTLDAKEAIARDAMSFVRFPAGVDWGGQTATVAIGRAAKGDPPLEVRGQLASVLVDPPRAATLRGAASVPAVLEILAPDDPDEEDEDDLDEDDLK